MREPNQGREKNADRYRGEYPLTFGIFANAADAFRKIDFSFLKLKIFKLNSREFEEFVYDISIFSSDYFDVYYDFIEGPRSGDRRYMYVLVPEPLAPAMKVADYEKIEKVLQIMFPSDFKLFATVSYDSMSDGTYSQSDYYKYEQNSHWRLLNNYRDNHELLLDFSARQSKKVNEFFRQAWDRVSSLKYLETGIDSYNDGFYQRDFKMGYINYCITLESILEKTQSEIGFQIARMCAVINADNKEHGHQIFKATKEFYNGRSTIVHGGKPADLVKYFMPLQALVSRTLIELISLNIGDKKDLIKLINENGYGDIRNFNTGYKKYDFNSFVTQRLKAFMRH